MPDFRPGQRVICIAYDHAPNPLVDLGGYYGHVVECQPECCDIEAGFHCAYVRVAIAGHTATADPRWADTIGSRIFFLPNELEHAD